MKYSISKLCTKQNKPTIFYLKIQKIKKLLANTPKFQAPIYK